MFRLLNTAATEEPESEWKIDALFQFLISLMLTTLKSRENLPETVTGQMAPRRETICPTPLWGGFYLKTISDGWPSADSNFI